MLLLYTKGRPSGDAYVQLVSAECAKTATTDLHRQHMGERYIEVFPCSGVDIASIITSSTINQTKVTSVNNTPYSHPCSYPVTNGMVTSPNGTHMNGHTDNITATSACRSPTGMYVPHSPTYFNCVMPTSGIGGSVSYYPPASTNVRMRMSPYLPQPYEMIPFFQGYQVIQQHGQI